MKLFNPTIWTDLSKLIISSLLARLVLLDVNEYTHSMTQKRLYLDLESMGGGLFPRSSAPVQSELRRIQ